MTMANVLALSVIGYGALVIVIVSLIVADRFTTAGHGFEIEREERS